MDRHLFDFLASEVLDDMPLALHDFLLRCSVLPELTAVENVALPLLVVDYDLERALRQKLGVRTQSTLIVYRGNRETARLAGETDAGKLKAALRSAL